MPPTQRGARQTIRPMIPNMGENVHFPRGPPERWAHVSTGPSASVKQWPQLMPCPRYPLSFYFLKCTVFFFLLYYFLISHQAWPSSLSSPFL